MNRDGAVWRIGDEGYFWSFCSSTPPEKKGGLVVSNRIKTKTRSHIFVSKGGGQILVLVLWVCEGDGWKGSQGREITDWVAATEAES